MRLSGILLAMVMVLVFATPALTSDVESLVPDAGPLCDAAFTSPQYAKTPPEGPVFTMIRIGYEDTGWNAGLSYDSPADLDFGPIIVPHNEARSESDVRCLLCIKEDRKKVGKFEDGAPAYGLSWDVRLVGWPDGKVLAKKRFKEHRGYFLSKVGPGPGYYPPPRRELYEWLKGTFKMESVIFTGGMVEVFKLNPAGTAMFVQIGLEPSYWRIDQWIQDRGKQPKGRPFYILDWGGLYSASISPDGELLAVTTDDGSVALKKTATGKIFRTLEKFPNEQKPVNRLKTMAFSPDGEILAAESVPGEVALWNPVNGREIGRFSGPAPRVKKLFFSPDGKTLAALFVPDTNDQSAGVVEVRNVPALEKVANQSGVPAERGTWIPAAWTKDGRTLVYQAPEGKTEVWRDGRPAETHPNAESVVISPDGELLALVNGDAIEIVKSADGGQSAMLYGHLGKITGAAFIPDTGYLISTSKDKSIRLWDLAKECPEIIKPAGQ